ncbi:MAG: zinc-binding dehydrogenase [Chloroflexi bacterium]|nr:zinc-binding dehydrogenase [Chloroflexota bacterium]
MRQLMWLGGATQQIQDVPTPEPGPGQVRVRVHACGVCMTEVHYAEGLFPTPEPAPFVWGHEWGGTVEAVGPGVTDLPVGTVVAVSSRGGFAEQVVVAAEQVVVLPPGVLLDTVIFIEPLACCYASVRAAAPRPGMTALVTGAGPMGQMTAQLTRLGGARVLVSDPDERCRALALELGAAAVVDPLRESVADAVKAFAGPDGVDIALETAGRGEPLVDCLWALKPGGTAIMVGVNSDTATMPFPLWRFHRWQLKLEGVYGSGGVATFREAAQLLPRLQLTRMISHRFGLGEIDTAYDLARSGQRGKILIDPWC